MKRKSFYGRKLRTKVFAAVASAALVFGTFAGTGYNPKYLKSYDTYGVTAEAAQTVDYGLADTSQHGVILHCWNWSYNNIRKYMKDIAAAGYTSVQTSPVQQPKDYYWKGVAYGNVGIPDGCGGEDGNWWKFYQPVTFSICDNGHTWLGTKAEFKAMCDEAEKYGVKVIVDIVANHMGNIKGYKIGDVETVMGDISPQIGEFWKPEMLTDPTYWHISTSWTHTSDGRFDVTQGNMGQPDLNTGDSRVQQMVLGLLKECIDCGADGFRFDAAKHIETPKDDPAFASDFWDVVLDGARAYYKEKNGKDGIFFYGETLNRLDDTNVEAYYRSKMSITDNSTSDNLRNSVINGSVNALASSGYCSYIAGQADKAVLWAESHDTYMGGGSSYDASDLDIKRTWAIIASRKSSTGLFFARPYYSRDILSGDVSKQRQSTATILSKIDQAQLGDVGTLTWADPSVVAVNRFRNFFIGQSEKLGSTGNTAYNVRGNKGIVIVRGEGQGSVSINAGMADGTYYDQVTGEKFTCTNGVISGKVTGDDAIAVVYNPAKDYGPVNPEQPVIVRLNAVTETGKTSFSTKTVKVTMSAGDKVTGEYTTSEGAKGTFTGTKTIEVGAFTATGGNVSVQLKGTTEDGTVKTKAFMYKKINAKEEYPALAKGGVVFDNSNYTWSKVYCYVYDANKKSAAAWPGEEMTPANGNFYTYEIPETLSGNVYVIFNNGDGSQYPRGEGLTMAATDKKLFRDEDTGFEELPAPKKVLGATLTANKTTAAVGEAVTLKAVPENADGTVKYSYLSNDGQTINSTSATATWTPTKEGEYIIAVNVADSSNEVTAVTKITVKGDKPQPTELVNTSYVSQHAIVGEKVVLKGSATGGDGNYKFAYYYRRNSDKTWKTAGTEWGTSQYATFKPGYADVYEICIKVKDGNGTTVKKYLSLAANKTDNSLECYGTVSNTIYTFGKTIKITGSAKNNIGTVKYKYEFRKASSWTFETIKDYSSSTSVQWTAPQKGAFTIRITADDGTNKAIRTINIKVK